MDDLETVDDWTWHFKKEEEMLRDLILDDKDELVELEEFYRRLYVKYGIVTEEEEDGTIEFKDPTAEWRSDRAKDDEVVESVTSRENVPVIKGSQMILTDDHPDDLSDPQERAEQQVKFNENVNEAFEEQLEEEDDPFPLEYPDREE